MDLPKTPVTLNVSQVEELCRQFSTFRHDVNGCLALVVAATELIRYNPSVLKRMAGTLIEQPPKIAGKVREFAEECERALGLRSATEGVWFPALWKHANHGSVMPTGPVSLTADQVKSIYNEVTHLSKEIAQLGFMISGVRTLGALNPTHAADALPNVTDQFIKAAAKFEQLAVQIERNAQIQDTGPRRLSSTAPSQPVTLAPAQVELFHRRLLNFERDMQGHLVPLLELSSLSRRAPEELPPRAGEFSEASPKISTEMNTFALEFDRTFGIVRSGQSR